MSKCAYSDVLAYNLAMDKLLGLNFIPDSVNDMRESRCGSHSIYADWRRQSPHTTPSILVRLACSSLV